MDEATRRALADLQAIEEDLFRGPPSPGANPQALDRVRRVLFALQSADSYVLEKKGKLLRAAEIYFSARRWARHPGGAPALQVELLSNSRLIREQLLWLAARPGR